VSHGSLRVVEVGLGPCPRTGCALARAAEVSGGGCRPQAAARRAMRDPWQPMTPRRTDRAVAEAAPLEAAKAAAGARGAGSQDPLVGEMRRAGLLRLLVLHFLRDDASYGGRLMERVGEVSGGLIAVNPNTMYPLLRELEAEGLVAGEWEHPERRSRRFYRLTPAGDAERRRLASELAPRLDAVAASLEAIRAELRV
jgi:PadR family transcriptional regulator, regulatory protein PadR